MGASGTDTRGVQAPSSPTALVTPRGAPLGSTACRLPPDLCWARPGLPELALPVPQNEEDRALSRAEVLRAAAMIPLVVEPRLCSVGTALRATRRFLSVSRCRLSARAGCVPCHMLDEVTSGKCRKPTTFWVLDTWFSWICQQVKSVRRRDKKASVLFIEGNMNPKGRG